MAKPKRTHPCKHPACADLPPFATVTEHLVHVSLVHPPARLERGELMLREVSCWRCATQYVPAVRDQATCPACGYVLPLCHQTAG